MSKLKANDKLCFVNFIFKNGCTDSVAVAKSKEHLQNNFTKKLGEYGKGIKNDILILGGIHGYVYVDLSTVAKMEISDKDNGPLIMVNSQVNDDEIDKKWGIRWMKQI